MAAKNAVGNSLTGSTGTGTFVGATSPTLVTPALGTPASGALTNCTSIPVANATGNLAIANGGTGVSSSKPVIQRVYTQTGAATTVTTQIPADDTIPQNTEGTEVMSLAITPTNSSNLLQVDVVVNLAASTLASPTIALFRDSTASAVASTWTTVPTANYVAQLTTSYTVAAGSTSATTFKVRLGPNVAATVTFNGQSGGRIHGGVLLSSISITELSA